MASDAASDEDDAPSAAKFNTASDTASDNDYAASVAVSDEDNDAAANDAASDIVSNVLSAANDVASDAASVYDVVLSRIDGNMDVSSAFDATDADGFGADIASAVDVIFNL